MLYISELCKDCAVANEIDYEIGDAWTCIYDNRHVITACDVLTLTAYRPYAYDVIISLRPPLGDIGLHVNAVVSDVPAADHKCVQGPQHGGAMMSVHKGLLLNCFDGNCVSNLWKFAF